MRTLWLLAKTFCTTQGFWVVDGLVDGGGGMGVHYLCVHVMMCMFVIKDFMSCPIINIKLHLKATSLS